MKVAAFIALGLIAGAFAASISITGTIRDFTPDHPDFEHYLGAETGITQNELDVDGKPVLAAGAHATVTSAASFAQWYRDTDGVNIPVSYTIVLDEISTGIYSFSSNSFFPIDGMAYGNYGGYGHNFHFTSEFRNTFTYMAGQTFTFTGDDDVFVFINNKLALDLGGVHGSMTASINLDSLGPTLGMTIGNNYELVVFHAERHTTESNFRIDTSIVLVATPPDDGTVTQPGRDAYICEVYFPNFCPGSPVSPSTKQTSCPNDPYLHFGSAAVHFNNFNAISFGGFFAPSGDVEGRVAVQGDVTIGQYSVGYELRTGGSTAWDESQLYSLVVGGDLTFLSGAVYPDGTDFPYPGPKENIFVGGAYSGADYIQSDVTGGPCASAGCLDADFENAQAYYTLLSNSFAAVTPNAVATIQYQGLTLTCDDATASAYSVNIDAADFSTITYYNTPVGCNENAQIVFNIGGTANVLFAGDNFYHTQEKVLYNIIGSGRTVTVTTEVRGSILAPNSIYYQPGQGVVKGLVIVGDIQQAHQINRVHCQPPPPPPPAPSSCPAWETACTGLNFPLANGVYSFKDFNVITFDSFNAGTGDIEGRLAAANDVTLGNGYSIGFELQTAPGNKDNSLPYSLIVGRDLTWGSGSLHPDGTGIPYPGNEEDMFVGRSASVPSYLTSRRSGGPCSADGCLNSYFSAAQQCYAGYQSALSQSDNVVKSISFSGLFITCNDASADQYYITLTPADMAQYTYTSVDNCNVQANWAINIGGTGDVLITGDSFPGVPGAIVYNVIGSGRTITVEDTSVNGAILAPFNTLNQTGGVILGKVVAGNIINALQVNRENTCPDDGEIENPVLTTRQSSSNSISVVNSGNARAGDTARFPNGQTARVTAVSVANNEIYFDAAANIENGARVSIIMNRLGGRTPATEPSSSASVAQVAVAVTVALVALLF